MTRNKYLSRLGFMMIQSALIFGAGCSHYQPGQIQEGSDWKDKPGLFSGEKGYFDMSGAVGLNSDKKPQGLPPEDLERKNLELPPEMKRN